MLDNLFKGLFDTALTDVIGVTDFLLCLGFSLLLGLLMAFAYMYRTRYTKSFVVTLALLPAVVCVVIMMVNGNVGTGVAVAGRFQPRSFPFRPRHGEGDRSPVPRDGRRTDRRDGLSGFRRTVYRYHVRRFYAV